MSRQAIISTRDLSPERPLISAVDGNRKTGNGRATFKTSTAAANAAKAAAEEAKAAAEVACRAACSAASDKRECETIITHAWERMEARRREHNWVFLCALIGAMAAFLCSHIFFD